MANSLKQNISWYLMASYIYYIEGKSVIPDSHFDSICKEILSKWEARSVHPHWKLLDKEALECGSGYQIAKEKYPWSIRMAAKGWIGEHPVT